VTDGGRRHQAQEPIAVEIEATKVDEIKLQVAGHPSSRVPRMSLARIAFPKCTVWWPTIGSIGTLWVCGLAVSAHAAPLEIHVTTGGSDEWAGSVRPTHDFGCCLPT